MVEQAFEMIIPGEAGGEQSQGDGHERVFEASSLVYMQVFTWASSELWPVSEWPVVWLSLMGKPWVLLSLRAGQTWIHT